MLTLQDLLQHYPEFQNKQIKLVRHSLQSDKAIVAERGVAESDRAGLLNLEGHEKLRRLRMDLELLRTFSSEYAKGLLDGFDVVMIFASTGKKSAEFLGAFSVLGTQTCQEWVAENQSRVRDIPLVLKNADVAVHLHMPELGYSAQPGSNGSFYKVDYLGGEFNSEFRRRLVIGWNSPVNWHQKDLNKTILAIRPAGFVREWDGYYDFTLSYSELCDLVDNEEGNPDWKGYLSHAAGVYVILDNLTGKQYVGSAYGASGIWGRWVGYRKTGHNSNDELVKLFANDPDYARNFQFSILKIMDHSSKKDAVIREESLIKEKLGSRRFGYNAN